MKKSSIAIQIALGLLILLCLTVGARNYNVLLNSDQYSYLIYGQALSRGSFRLDHPLTEFLKKQLPPGSFKPLGYGRRYYLDGNIFSGLEPGFPLLLGIGIRLGGIPAAFGVNMVLLAVFIIAYFLALRKEGIRSEPAALAAVFVFLSWENNLGIRYSLILMRDIPALAFLWLGLSALFKAARPGARTLIFVLFATAATAFSCMIRLSNLVLFPPLTVYALVALQRKGVSWKTITLGAVVAALVCVLIFLPQILEDWTALRRPVAFLSRALAPFEDFFEEEIPTAHHVFSLANLKRNLPRNLYSLLLVISPPGVFLLAAGLFFCRHRLSTWLVMLPAPILTLLTFSAYSYRARRYRFPVYPFAAYFIATGAVWILDRWRRPPASPFRRVVSLVAALCALAFLVIRLFQEPAPDSVNVFLAVFALAAILSAVGVGWNRLSPGAVFTVGVGAALAPFLFAGLARQSSFNWGDVLRLRREVENVVPLGAVVLGERYLIQNIDMYTHAHGISPGNLTTPLGMSLEEAVALLDAYGRPVFAFDNRGYRSMRRPLDRLRSYFELELVGRWLSADLKLANPYYSRNELLSLYRLKVRSLPGSVEETILPGNTKATPGRQPAVERLDRDGYDLDRAQNVEEDDY